MTSLVVTHADGSTDTINQTLGWSRRREIGGMRRVVIDVERSDAQAANLVEKEDDIALGSIDTVRLVDIESGGSTWTLTGYSYEWLSETVAPTAGGNLREGTDQELVNGLISDVPDWTAGTVNSFTSDLSFVFNHAARAEALRRIEKNVPGEIQFRDTGTVDYIDSLGSDKTSSVTLSAANGNIEGEINITKRGRELDGTHIRVLGAHEGEAQFFANLVPSDDPASYDNRVDYTTSRWESGDTRDWDRYVNKDVTDQATIEEEAAALGDEITDPLIEATTVVPNSVGLAVGDMVHVRKTDENDNVTLDRNMRVHRVQTKTGSRNNLDSAAAVVDEILLSTRTTVRKGDSDYLEDVQRFNTGFQGSSVAINAGPYGKALNSSNPFVFNFRYPDLAFENTAQLHVKGLEYRVDSQGADVQNGTTLSIINSPSLNSDSTVPTGGSLVINDTVDPAFSGYVAFIAIEVLTDKDETFPLVINADGPNEPSFEATLYPNELGNMEFFATDPNLEAGDTYELEISNPLTNPSSVTIEANSGWTMYDPNHTHSVNPGIFTTTDAPSGVDVLINGGSVATDIGTGVFETVVDVGGEFTNDAWNTVELQSDSLGILEVTAYIEGYDKIGTQS